MRNDLDEVKRQITRIAERSDVHVTYEPRSYNTGCACGGVYCGSFARMPEPGYTDISRPIINLAYNVAEADPARLFWTFGHELGHVQRNRRGIYAYNGSPATVMAHEIAAWNYAEALANISPWPADERFFNERRNALGTYGIAA